MCPVSYDFAVWEGERPKDGDEAAKAFEALYDRYVEAEADEPPTPAIRAFVQSLLERYPDVTELDDDAVDESPWASGPLIGEATGPFMYFPVSIPRAPEMQEFVAAKAREHGLVCFDPQAEELLT